MVHNLTNTNADGLLVARICHDLKNCLSVITFLKEDIADGTVDIQTGLSNLLESIDKLSLRLSFFQNLAVDGAHIGNLYEMLQQMCKGSNVKLIFDINTRNDEQNCDEQNVVCGILYLVVVDSLRSGKVQTIIVEEDANMENVSISLFNTKADDLPQEINDIAEMEEVPANVVNALALYVRRIMKRHGYHANIFEVNNCNELEEPGVKIILKKLS